jgi:hypothetical protein
VTAPAPDFSGSVNPTSVTVAAGSSATLALTVTPLGGSTQTVTISCGGLPANSTCGFSPGSSVTLDGSHASTVTVTFHTNVVAALRSATRSPLLASFGGGLGGALLGLGAMGAALRRRMRFGLAALGAMLALASCGGGHGGGGGGSGPVTPSGTYPLTISLVSGATTHTVGATLIVD